MAIFCIHQHLSALTVLFKTLYLKLYWPKLDIVVKLRYLYFCMLLVKFLNLFLLKAIFLLILHALDFQPSKPVSLYLKIKAAVGKLKKNTFGLPTSQLSILSLTKFHSAACTVKHLSCPFNHAEQWLNCNANVWIYSAQVYTLLCFLTIWIKLLLLKYMRGQDCTQIMKM